MALSPNLLQPFMWGRGGAALTPEQVAREREIAEALVAQGIDTSPVGDWTQGAARMANVLAGKIREGRASSAEAAGREAYSQRLSSLFGGAPMASTPPQLGGSPATSTAMATAPAPDYASARVAQAHGDSGGSFLPVSFLSALDKTEGGGSYDTLFGHAQRSGPFAGTAVSKMPISEVLAFASPSGAYGQHVKSKVGRVATPMGRHQIVGTTLRNAVKELGIDPSTVFDAQTQDRIAGHLARKRLASSSTMDGKIAALRSEWEGFKSVPRSQLEVIIRDLESAPSDPVAANEAMASGELANKSLTADAVQQWAAQNYAPVQTAGVTVAETPEEILAAEAAMAASPGAQPRLPQTAPMLPEPTMVPDLPVAEIAQSLTNANVNPDIPLAGGTSGFAPLGTQAPNVSLPKGASFSLPDPSMAVAQSLAAQPQQQGGMPSMQQLMELASDPWATDAQRQVVGALLKQQMEQSDPYRQAQLEKLRLETEALRNPAAPKLINAGDGRLYDPASGQWITAPDMGTPKPTEAEARISRLTENLMSTGDFIDPMEAQNIATGIVDGRLRADRHPVTGVLQVVDMATGQPAYQQRPAPPSAQGVMTSPEATTPSNQFGQQFPNAPGSFGVGGAAQGAINRISDAFGAGPVYPDVAQTQADFAVLRESLLNDIASSYGRQPPSWLLKEIRDLTPEAGSVLQGAGAAQSKLNALGRHLQGELDNTNRALQRELSPTNRQEMEARQQGLIAGLERVNGAIRAFQPQQQQQQGGDIPPAPQGVDPEDWKYMTPEERALFP